MRQGRRRLRPPRCRRLPGPGGRPDSGAGAGGVRTKEGGEEPFPIEGAGIGRGVRGVVDGDGEAAGGREGRAGGAADGGVEGAVKERAGGGRRGAVCGDGPGPLKLGGAPAIARFRIRVRVWIGEGG